MIKKIIKKTAERMGYVIFKKDNPEATIHKRCYPSDIRQESEFISIHGKSSEYTVVNKERSFALYKAVEYISQNNIEGDFVECGVWRGGQVMIMAHTLLKENDKSRKIWLYDTYTGMSEPTDKDIKTSTQEKAKNLLLQEKKSTQRGNIWCQASLEEVKKNVESTGYNPNNFVFVKGKVEDTIPGEIPSKISLLRLDTDWYESTYHELVHLFPRLVKGGVLIIDDYGDWEGSKKAVDQYIKEKNVKIFLIRVSKGRIGIRLD